MAEQLICDSYLFKFKNKRTNIGGKKTETIYQAKNKKSDGQTTNRHTITDNKSLN